MDKDIFLKFRNMKDFFYDTAKDANNCDAALSQFNKINKC
jgi:hypothetical protein